MFFVYIKYMHIYISNSFTDFECQFFILSFVCLVPSKKYVITAELKQLPPSALCYWLAFPCHSLYGLQWPSFLIIKIFMDTFRVCSQFCK